MVGLGGCPRLAPSCPTRRQRRFLAEANRLRGRIILGKVTGLYMDDNRVLQEHKRLEDLLERADVPHRQRDVLAPVIDNMA